MNVGTGFYKAMSFENYLADPAISKSGLVDMAQSPAHYKERRENPKTFAAADLGSATHMMILEPERAERSIFTPPGNVLGKGGTRGTTAYREWAAAQEPGAIILSREEFEAAHRMRDSVLHHPVAADLLSGGFPEISAIHYVSDVRVKTRPDYLNDGYITDIKTTVDASPETFGRQAYNLKYYWSAYLSGLILRGLEIGSREYAYVAVEKTPPYPVAVYYCPPELVELAGREVEPLLRMFRACNDTGIWPGYEEDITPLRVPGWVKHKLMDMEERDGSDEKRGW